jgi:cytochrome c oxidase subunit 2
MALQVIAESPDGYAKWEAGQRTAAKAPGNAQQQQGQRVFLRGTCPMCHTVSGTEANAQAGPDLTHLASRRTLAAGTIPNSRGHLAGWVLNPQAIKPGANMPPHSLPADDLNALLAYLQSLT